MYCSPVGITKPWTSTPRTCRSIWLQFSTSASVDDFVFVNVMTVMQNVFQFMIRSTPLMLCNRFGLLEAIFIVFQLVILRVERKCSVKIAASCLLPLKAVCLSYGFHVWLKELDCTSKHTGVWMHLKIIYIHAHKYH